MSDHRLMVVEPELAATFKVAARDTNTLSPVVRQAWDTGALRTLTRNNPLKAKGAHISIVGHITAEELKRHLTSTEAANGFANRFLWLLVRRSKKLPDGGNLDPHDLAPHVQRVTAALAKGRRQTEMRRDPAARDLWHQVYDQLSEGEPGLAGAMIARSEAQVTRLSLIYALADGATTIQPPHLEAALELWHYSARSVRHLFGETTGDPDVDTIEQALQRTNGDGLSRTEISALFGRHASAARIDRALGTLVARQAIQVTRQETGGRPVGRWLTSHSSLTSRSQEWPGAPSDAVYHGPLGELVHTIEPHTEADPLAILTQLLVAFGNAIGRTPYVPIEADRLPQRLHRPCRRHLQGTQRHLLGASTPRDTQRRPGLGRTNHGRTLERRGPHRAGVRTRNKRPKRMKALFKPAPRRDPRRFGISPQCVICHVIARGCVR